MKKQINRIFFLLSIILLSTEFYNNALQTVNPLLFNSFQKDSESLSVGRLLRSQKDGPFSYGGFLGWNHPLRSSLSKGSITPFLRFDGWGYDVPNYPSKFFYQYDAFQGDFQVNDYEEYFSQSGGQTFLYYLLGSLFNVSGSHLIICCRLLNAIFLAFLLSCFLGWSTKNIGIFSSLCCLVILLLSQWLIVFANNMLYVSGLFFLPFIANLFYIQFYGKDSGVKTIWAFMLTFLTVFCKCLIAGFDFIIPTLIMSMIPFIFYSIVYSWPTKKTLVLLLSVSLAAAIGVIAGIVILALQIAHYQSWGEAIDYIITTSERRTYGNQEDLSDIYKSSQSTSFYELLNFYTNSLAIDLNHLPSKSSIPNIKVSFQAFFLAFMVGGLVVPFLNGPNLRVSKALVVTMIISALGPIGWFVIFKYHAISHKHMNLILWHMPLMLFGSLFIGHVLNCVASLSVMKIRTLFQNKNQH
jgi:hypothetical protein